MILLAMTQQQSSGLARGPLEAPGVETMKAQEAQNHCCLKRVGAAIPVRNLGQCARIRKIMALSVQVSRRCYQLLLVHMTRFTYSPTGALKWKKDVSEYAEVLSSYGIPTAGEDMAYLQQVCVCML